VQLLTLGVLVLAASPAAQAYSVLTHEAIIDTAWDNAIKPLLLARFPNATPDELRNAHSYAYAGSIIQDMGYYPFSNRFFSDLLHYVRSGDFIVNLIRDSQSLDEYAFALGALAHYAADTEGHSIAVNRAVPVEYPKLRRKYGNVVTYEDDKTAHMRVEFSFDVLQVARGNYAPQAYHDFIGFNVAKSLLERAFRDTYGLELTDVCKDLDLSLGTYRRSVSTVIPEMTRVAWNNKKEDLQKARPGVTRQQFVYRLSRAGYHKEWGSGYQKPGPGTRVLAVFIRILPKVGPLKVLSFKPPTAATERMFEDSVDRTLDRYGRLLHEQGNHQLQLADLDFDTGKPTRPGEYRMADNAYAQLAEALARKDPSPANLAVRQNVLAFFNDLNQPYWTKEKPDEWRETVAAVGKLKAEGSASRVQQ
jgi:hypothetical protein